MAGEKINPYTGNIVGTNPRITPEVRNKLDREARNKKRRMKKIRDKFGKKDGGLINAIEKVKAKEMELGGEAKPLVGGQKKLDKNKDGRISGDDFAMMEMGGKVEEYGGGGKVKGGKMSCRGMGAAIKGGGYTIS